MITVVIAEDHQALIDGMMSYVKKVTDIQVVGFANDGEALLQLVKTKMPMVVVTDIRMPKLDGIAVAEIIKNEFPKTRVIAFTMFDQEEAVQQMIKAGAKGYILKNSSLEVVLNAIRTVANGGSFYEIPINAEIPNDHHTDDLLSIREKEVLHLIAKGHTSHQIADELCIGKSTVDSHRKNMIRKLGLSGAGELLRYAVERKYEF